MYALFEKQERTRKIEELKELCAPAGEDSSFGGLTDEEAGRALDLCDGDEQQAAAALTGELGAAFRRRCMEPERIAEMKEDKKRERAAAKRSAAKVGGKWHAMPDPSMRGKPVDRAQLEGAIFVGAFRGKGFQGNGKSGKMVLRKLTEKETGASDAASDAASGGDAGKENADDVVMAEAAVEGAVGAGGAGGDGVDLPSGTPGGSKEPLSQSQEDNMAGAKSVSPKGVNRKSTPKAGPTPKSTARGKKRTSIERAGACTDGAGVCGGASAPQQQQQPSPTRKSVRQRTSTAPAIEEIDPNKTDDHLGRINATESDEEAAAFLNSLGSDKLVSHLLQALGASDPIRAIGIRQAFDELIAAGAAGAADEGVPAVPAAVVVPELAPADVPDAELQAPVDRSNANANASTIPPAESEGTVSVQVVEDTTTQANTPASKQKPKVAAPKAKFSAQPAVSVKGHTHRGRVKQKSHKSAELIEAGTLRLEKGWFNAGYIFPEGFKSRTLFRSSVALDSLCVHECDIIGKGGLHWPLPTFRVVALDRPDEPLLAKSCTGCWTAILKRINSEIEARRQAGEDLPPPPKTAIAGPEYFGFNQADIQEAVEALDPNREVEVYWAGKVERNRARKGLPPDPAKAKTVRRTTTVVSDKVNKVNAGASGAGAPAPRRGRRPAARTTSSGHDVEEEDDGDEANFVASRCVLVVFAVVVLVIVVLVIVVLVHPRTRSRTDESHLLPLTFPLPDVQVERRQPHGEVPQQAAGGRRRRGGGQGRLGEPHPGLHGPNHPGARHRTGHQPLRPRHGLGDLEGRPRRPGRLPVHQEAAPLGAVQGTDQEQLRRIQRQHHPVVEVGVVQVEGVQGIIIIAVPQVGTYR